MKNVIFVAVVLSVVLGVSGCSKSDGGEESSTESSSSTTKQLLSLNLTTQNIELEEGAEMTLTLSGDYSRGASKPITSNITWIIDNTSILNIHNTTLRALKEGTTTIRAKVDGKLSQKLTITVYKVIQGHRLPPEPDEKLNDSTLLGIDVNGNGVRDDVERYIHIRFSKDARFPKTKIAIAMQRASAFQKVIKSPTIDNRVYVSGVLGCQAYWFGKINYEHNQETMRLNRVGNRKEAIKLSIKASKWERRNRIYNEPALKDKILNTRKRIERWFEFNAALSGGIYELLPQTIESCQTNIDELGELNQTNTVEDLEK